MAPNLQKTQDYKKTESGNVKTTTTKEPRQQEVEKTCQTEALPNQRRLEVHSDTEASYTAEPTQPNHERGLQLKRTQNAENQDEMETPLDENGQPLRWCDQPTKTFPNKRYRSRNSNSEGSSNNNDPKKNSRFQVLEETVK